MSEYSVTIPWGQEKQVYTETFNNREMFLGAIGATPDGRVFRWCYSGGAISAGERVETSPAVAADDQDLAVQTAAAVGDTSVSITTGGAITVNLYADGYLSVNDADGEGHLYAIKSHKVAAGVETLVINLREPIREALVTGSGTLVGLVKNPYKDVIIGTAASTAGATVGVAPTVVANNTYFWCQESGVGICLAEDPAMVIGDGVEKGVDVAGAFQLLDVSAETNQHCLGELMQVAPAAGDHAVVLLHVN